MAVELATEKKRFNTGLFYSSVRYVVHILSAFAYSALVSRLFGASLIGAFAFMMTFIGIFNIVSNLGEQGGLVKLINKYKADNPQVTALVILFLLTSFTVTAILSIPFVLISQYLFNAVFHQPSMIAPFSILALSYILFNNSCAVLNNVYVAFQEMKYALIIEIFLAAVKLSSVFLIFWHFGRDIYALITLQVILDLFSLIMAVIFLSRVIRLRIDVTPGMWKEAFLDLKEVLIFGFKLMPKNYNFMITEYIDRILIPLFTSNLMLLGLYVTAYQLFSKVFMFTAVFCRMLFPSLARMSMKDQLDDMLTLYNDSIKKMLLIMVFVVAFAGSFSTQVMGIFGEEFKEANIVLLILLPGLIAETFSIASATLLQAFNRPGIVSIYCFVGSIANLLLNLLLIPIMGIKGAAISNSCGLLMMAIFLYANACRIAKCNVIGPSHTLIYTKILLIGALLFGLGAWTQQFAQTFPLLILFSVLFLILYLILLEGLAVYSIKPLFSTLIKRVSIVNWVTSRNNSIISSVGADPCVRPTPLQNKPVIPSVARNPQVVSEGDSSLRSE